MEVEETAGGVGAAGADVAVDVTGAAGADVDLVAGREVDGDAIERAVVEEEGEGGRMLDFGCWILNEGGGGYYGGHSRCGERGKIGGVGIRRGGGGGVGRGIVRAGIRGGVIRPEGGGHEEECVAGHAEGAEGGGQKEAEDKADDGDGDGGHGWGGMG
ncbi:MAG: hypothetical protein RLZ97_1908 [Verrucomicrobiota bacterium]